MIVCKKKQLVYFHNPKTAGSSITFVLAPHSTKAGQLDMKELEKQGSGWQGKVHHDGHQHFRMTHTQYGEFRNFFKFSFVRNPFDMVLGFYEKTKERHHVKTFEQFLTSVWYRGPDHALKYTQTEYLDADNLDFIGRYENLYDDWKFIANKFDLPNELPHFNQRKNPQLKDYRKHYDETTRMLVEKRYRKDLEVFNYDF